MKKVRWGALVAAIGSILALGVAFAPSALGFSQAYCNVYVSAGNTCNHGNENSIIYNRADSSTAWNACVYMRTAQGYLRGNVEVCYNSTYQARMCVSSPTPMSRGYTRSATNYDYFSSVVNNSTHDSGCAV